MKRICSLTITVALVLYGARAFGSSITFDFEDGTDQGFGTGFGNDASKSFPIVNIGGSNRMETTLGGFQVAGRVSTSTADPLFVAMDKAANNPTVSTVSYDWYVDTSLDPAGVGTFLQLGTYINSFGGAYNQDFPNVNKEVELNGTQLASGQVFSGHFSGTFNPMYGNPFPAGYTGQGGLRFGLILNGNGSDIKVYFDNITINGVPEPASLALAGMAIPALVMVARRRRK
jgi:hypothetical protein